MTPYIILILVNAAIACMLIYGCRKYRHEKTRKEYYKNLYYEAKAEWAAQSNAVREKGIECDQLAKENKKLEKDLEDANERLGHLDRK